MNNAIILSPESLILWGALSLVVAYWAYSRGSSFFVALIGALIISPVIMALAVAVTPVQKKALEDREIVSGEKKKCPFCAEMIQREAIKCRFCGESLATAAAVGGSPSEGEPQEPRKPIQRRPGAWNNW